MDVHETARVSASAGVAGERLDIWRVERLPGYLGFIMACYIGGGAVYGVVALATALISEEAGHYFPEPFSFVAGMLGLFLLPIGAGACYIGGMLAHLGASWVFGRPVASLAPLLYRIGLGLSAALLLVPPLLGAFFLLVIAARDLLGA